MPTLMTAPPSHHRTPAVPPPASDHDLRVRIASTADDYEAAFRLAYDVYYPLGYTAPDPAGMRVSPYQLRATAFVLLAYHHTIPVGTMTLYADDPDGLPGDEGWGGELDALRAAGHRLFESGALVVSQEGGGAGDPKICFALFRHALVLAQRTPQACFCSFVQLRHAAFYQQALCHRRFGQPRHYRWNGLDIPDVTPLLLHLPGAAQEFRARYGLREEAGNLHRFFFADDHRQQISAGIDDDLRRRQRLDLAALRHRFAGSPLPSRVGDEVLC